MTPPNYKLCCGGIIQKSSIFDNWKTIKIKQSDGYKIDLLLRLREIADSFGNAINVRFWVTDKPTTREQAEEGFTQSMFGPVMAEIEATSYFYSEYTSGIDYDTMLLVGGHDLFAELSKMEGLHIWIEIETPCNNF